MGIRNLMASGLSFAHLSPKSKHASRAEDDRKDDERDDERAEDDEPEDRDRDDGDSNGSKGKKGRRAEDERDDENAEDDELEEDDSGKGKKGKRAEDDERDDERAEDEEDDEEEMRGKSAVARARRRERARCAAIMGSKAAGRNVELAANLAFNTSMTRQEALAILRASPAADSSSARSQSRAARNPQLGASAEVHRNPQREAANGWDRSFSKITGKRA